MPAYANFLYVSELEKNLVFPLGHKRLAALSFRSLR